MNHRKTKKIFRSFLALLTALALAVPVYSTYASSVNELEQETSDLQNQLNDLNDQLNSLSGEIESLVTQIDETDKEIKQTELDLAAARLSQDSQYEAMKMRIKYMYENGNTSLLEFICSAESMSEFLNNTEFVSAITEYDREMMESLKEVTEKVEAKERELETQKEQLAKAREELNSKQASLNSTISTVQNDLSSSSQQLADAKAVQAAAQASGGNSTSQSTAVSASASEVALFAAILHCEALQDDYDALLAVATIIMNRVESPKWPNTLRDVIYQKNQFSPVRTGKLDRILAKGPAPLCYTVAQDALNGARLNKVKNCYSFRMVGTWSNGIVIGDNIFF